jgi:hypothetical protein
VKEPWRTIEPLRSYSSPSISFWKGIALGLLAVAAVYGYLMWRFGQ